jgi:hypothetical protein
MPSNDGPTRPHRSWARVVSSVLVAAALLAAAASVAIWSRGVDAAEKPHTDKIAVQTVEIIRTDLSTRRTLTGSLGYGLPRVVKGGRDGVVTSLPRPGQVLKRGAVVYRVNDDPVPLFYGSVPLYRTLSEPGTVGRDVATVLENLKALGYATGVQPRPGDKVTAPDPAPEPQPSTRAPDSGTPAPTRVTVRAGESVLTAALIRAVRRWQRDVGMPEDGVLSVGDLVVLPGAVRVDTVPAVVGDSAAGELMSVTRTKKVVTARPDAAAAGSMSKGDHVTLRMPDGVEASGRIGSIANVATAAADQEPGSPQQVTVTIDLTGKASKLDGGDVEINFKGKTRTEVLAVPVNALLALREGGYALQLPDDTLLPVETGLFAMGLVEVTGEGLREGLAVVTTS